LRQTMKAITPNAPQIRTPMTQDTAFLFCSKYSSQQSGCEDVSQSQITSRKFSLGMVACCVRFGVRRRSRTAFKPRRLLFAEPIAETAHGFNRVAGFAQLLAQTTYMRVHGAGVDHAFVAPDIVEQFIAVLHPAPALD